MERVADLLNLAIAWHLRGATERISSGGLWRRRHGLVETFDRPPVPAMSPTDGKSLSSLGVGETH